MPLDSRCDALQGLCCPISSSDSSAGLINLVKLGRKRPRARSFRSPSTCSRLQKGVRLHDGAQHMQPARDAVMSCREYPCHVCCGGAVLLATELGCSANYGKHFPIKRELCMHNKRVIFLMATYSRNAAE